MKALNILSKLWWIPALFILWLVLHKLDVIPSFSFPNPFKSKPLIIAETPVLVREVKSISELFTIKYYEEVAVHETKIGETSTLERAGDVLSGRVDLFEDQDIVLIARGTVFAGFDLSKLSEKDILVEGDKITLNLPPAQILDVIINPSGFETFEEEGTWKNAEVKKVKAKARQQMQKMALRNGILAQSENSGIETLHKFLTSLGFKDVNIVIAGSSFKKANTN